MSFGIEMLARSALVGKRTTTMLALNYRSRLLTLPMMIELSNKEKAR